MYLQEYSIDSVSFGVVFDEMPDLNWNKAPGFGELLLLLHLKLKHQIVPNINKKHPTRKHPKIRQELNTTKITKSQSATKRAFL